MIKFKGIGLFGDKITSNNNYYPKEEIKKMCDKF